MLLKLQTNRVLWIVVFALTMAAALVGISVPGMYENLFPADFLPGALPQDILTALVCIALLFVTAFVKQTDIKRQIITIGVIGSLFYLYGIFTIERVYNVLYILYAAIFSLTFWSLVYSLSNVDRETLKTIEVPDGMRITSAVVSIVIAALFTFLWVSGLIPLMAERRKIEYLYSIYILDLCLVMPAFVITAIMSLRKKPLGIVLAPAMFIMGFFVIFPLGLNEAAKPGSGQTMNVGSLLLSFFLSAVFLFLASLHLVLLRRKTKGT
jgi:hypothetical protein